MYRRPFKVVVFVREADAQDVIFWDDGQGGGRYSGQNVLPFVFAQSA